MISGVNKTEFCETDIRTKFITPSITFAGWNPMSQIREELQHTAGRVMVQGKIARRRPGKRADYVLFYKPGIPIAIVEAKDNTHSVGAGIEQAIDYARLVDVPFVYSSNGDAFLERDLAVAAAPAERELPLTAFPSPKERWARWKGHAAVTPEQEQLVLQGYYTDDSGKALLDKFQDSKLYFTIVDFRRATNLFADPDFDGDPEVVYEPDDDEGLEEPDTSAEPNSDTTDHPESGEGEGDDPDTGDDQTSRRRYIVDGVPVDVTHERVQYLDEHGKLITESLQDYSRNRILDTYHSRDEFLAAWSSADRKALIIEELAEHGVILEALKEEVGADYDEFDLVCHIAFDEPPKTHRERAAGLRQSDDFSRYGDTARAVIDAILDKYAADGITTIEDTAVLRLPPVSHLGSVKELVKPFGGTRDGFLQAIRDLEAELYRESDEGDVA